MKKENFRYPILVLEDVFFKYGAAHNATKYKDTTNNLAKHAAINHKHGAAASTKAIKEIITPMFMVPNIEEVDTINKMEMKIWDCEYNKYDQDENSWVDNK